MFITGGASGLGEAMVRRMHAMGASVAVADINTKNMQSLQSELQTRILCIPCDVTSEKEVAEAV